MKVTMTGGKRFPQLPLCFSPTTNRTGKIGIRSGIFPSNYVRVIEEPQTSFKCGHIPNYSIQQELTRPFGTLMDVDEVSSQVASKDSPWTPVIAKSQGPKYIDEGGKNRFEILEQPYAGEWGATVFPAQKSQGVRRHEKPQQSSALNNSWVVTVAALPPIPIG
jgi:hypothetical protein